MSGDGDPAPKPADGVRQRAEQPRALVREIYPIDQEQQNKPVLVRDAQGVTRPLVEATLAAQVNGVLVVCPGANSARVCQQITEAVTTVLGIKSTQVCVFAGNR